MRRGDESLLEGVLEYDGKGRRELESSNFPGGVVYHAAIPKVGNCALRNVRRTVNVRRIRTSPDLMQVSNATLFIALVNPERICNNTKK
jgi:hypothetical protein